MIEIDQEMNFPAFSRDAKKYFRCRCYDYFGYHYKTFGFEKMWDVRLC